MWKIRFERRAEKAIAAMHPQMRRRVAAALDDLAADPYEAVNVKAMVGNDQFRLRVGGFRIIYRLERNLLIVVVIDVGPRGDVYK